MPEQSVHLTATAKWNIVKCISKLECAQTFPVDGVRAAVAPAAVYDAITPEVRLATLLTPGDNRLWKRPGKRTKIGFGIGA